MVEAISNKGGEDIIQTSLRRTTQGLLVTIKAHPRVEEFMQRLSGGEVVSVSSIGRNWLTEWTEPEIRVGDKVIPSNRHIIRAEPLRAYALHVPFEPFRSNDGTWIDLDRLGHPLLSQGSNDGSIRGNDEQLNMSFIRLVGISQPEGVQFLLKTVFSMNGMKKLRDSIQNAQNSFITEYIKNVEYTITTATQTI